jgi:pre-mRNA-splicing factor SYF2
VTFDDNFNQFIETSSKIQRNAMADNDDDVQTLSDNEVKQRLRLRGQPICYFGETAEDRLNRLLHLEGQKSVDYEEAKTNEIEEQKKELRRRELELQQEENEKYSHMSEQQKRLFKLRMQMNQCRKQNLEDIAKEHSQEEFMNKRRERLNQENENRVKKGLEPLAHNKAPFFKHKKRKREEEFSTSITAEDAESISLREKKKKQKLMSHRADPIYNAYKKRSNNIPEKLVQEYSQNKSSEEQDDLTYGVSKPIPEENKDLLATELEQKKQRLASYHRRRTNYEDEDVQHINERNRGFNKRLARAYDPYTAEIKSNLERGTAL